ncbi:MAG: hypothetical protein ABSF17_08910 [Terracidiphilus sp.]|jgi:tetrahydromethanopterin S-methyltransferase subunit B
MGFVPVMWGVWGLLIVLLLSLKVYAGRLSQNEDDQIFLDEAFEHMKNEQAAIAAKVNSLKPVRTAILYLAGAATVFVIGYYIFDIYTQFK